MFPKKDISYQTEFSPKQISSKNKFVQEKFYKLGTQVCAKSHPHKVARYICTCFCIDKKCKILTFTDSKTFSKLYRM